MNDQPTEEPTAESTEDTEVDPEEDHHYLVELIAHPYARDPKEAYQMAVDAMIHNGTKNFHPVITDFETGERWLLTPDDELVTGEQIKATLERLTKEQAEADAATD